MSRATRLGLVAVTVVVGVVAFALLRPSDDDSRPAVQAPDSERGASDKSGRRAEEAERSSKPALPVLRPGAVRTLEVRRGEQVRFAVRSPEGDEAHVHGYDLLKEVPAGGTVRFSFRAEFEGEFEIELERSGQEIGHLVVTP